MLRPLTELQVKWARGLCRGPDNGGASTPATLVIRADLGSAKTVRIVGVIGLNGVTSIAGVIKFSATGAGNSELGIGDLVWLDEWGETYGQSVWYPLPTAVSARYIEISLEVNGRSSGQRYVDARRLLIMDGMHMTDGWDSDWSTVAVDQSASEVTPKGGVFVAENNQYRIANFSATGMTEEEAKQPAGQLFSLEDAIRESGRKKEVVWAPRQFDPNDAYQYGDSDMFKNTIYGRLVEWAPIVHTGGDTYACDSIVVHETPYPAL